MMLSVRGERAAEGPLTLGQLNVFQWVSDTPDSVNTVLAVDLHIPQGTRLGDVVEVLDVLLARHEGLRTTYQGGVFPTQRVLGSGTLPVAVRAVDPPPGPEQRTALVAALRREVLAAAPALPTHGLPVRVAVATSRDDPDRVLAATLACTHLALDEQAAAVVQHEFAEMIDDPAARHRGGPRHQPLDQAAEEQTPVARHKAGAALRHWRRMMPLLPQCLYAAPRLAAAGASVAVRMESQAAAAALLHITARARATRSSVVLAAICAVLARRTGYDRLVFNTVSGNRFDPRLVDYVGSLAQGCVAGVDTAAASFDTLVRRAWAGSVQAAANGVFDASERAALGREANHARGLDVSCDPLFNCTVVESRGTPSGAAPPLSWLPEARTRTTYQVEQLAPTANLMRFDLFHLDGAVVLSAWTGDTGRVPVEELRALLDAVDRLLVGAAEADLDGAAMDRLIRLAPIPRGPGWLLVDSCWIELAEVQHLVEEALGEQARARVFAEVGGRPLVAHLVATDGVRTAEQAHARCLAMLPGRPTAMTPRRYVVCAAAPDDPDDPDDPGAWRPVITDGTGRSDDADRLRCPAGTDRSP